MSYRVTADSLFWDSVDRILPTDPVWQEIYDVAFALQQQGVEVRGAQPARWPLGPALVPGWSLDLPSGRGFIGYVGPEVLGGDRIYLAKLVLYDWPSA